MNYGICKELRDGAKAMLETGAMITAVVYAEPRSVVGLPPQFEGVVMLNLGYNLVNPTLDLDVNLVGFSATLQFNGVPSMVIVPWQSVVGVIGPEYGLMKTPMGVDKCSVEFHDGNMILAPHSTTLHGPTDAPEAPESSKPKRSHLSVVKPE